jgi:hypothetical protein
MAKRNEPTLLGQMWQKIEPTIMSEGASQSERIQLRTAFLSGANAMLVALTRARRRGGGRAAMQTLETSPRT